MIYHSLPAVWKHFHNFGYSNHYFPFSYWSPLAAFSAIPKTHAASIQHSISPILATYSPSLTPQSTYPSLGVVETNHSNLHHRDFALRMFLLLLFLLPPRFWAFQIFFLLYFLPQNQIKSKWNSFLLGRIIVWKEEELEHTHTRTHE